jgi:hypothetical protein
MFEAAFAKPAFRRYQFSIGINFATALKSAGLYSEELDEASKAIGNEMPGKGWIVFTWLEPELWYVNTSNLFSSPLELHIDLPAFGTRQPQRPPELSDSVEMRLAEGGGYELVLLTREQRYCWPESTRDKGVVLFKLPYKFFWALQGNPFEGSYERHKNVETILTAAGFTLFSDNEIPDIWDYRNDYGSFRWWGV